MNLLISSRASDQGSPSLSSESFLEIRIARTNASYFNAQASSNQNRYIIIAGVIAGVTFVIAVVVIAIIVHLRASDNRRRTARNVQAKNMNKIVRGGPGVEDGSVDNAKNMTVLSKVLSADESKQTKSLPSSPYGPSFALLGGSGFEHRDLSNSTRVPSNAPIPEEGEGEDNEVVEVVRSEEQKPKSSGPPFLPFPDPEVSIKSLYILSFCHFSSSP